MDDVKSVTEKSVAMPKSQHAPSEYKAAPKKLSKVSKKQSFPEPHEVVRMVQENHRLTQNVVRGVQSGAFYTDHGS